MSHHPRNNRRPALGATAPLIVLLAGILLNADTRAQVSSSSSAACCLKSSSVVSAYLNPPVGEDNQFFRGRGGRANVAFAFMRPGRMLELPFSLHEIRTAGAINATNNGAPAHLPLATLTKAEAKKGCENSFLNGLRYFHPSPRNSLGVPQPTWVNQPYTPANDYGPLERSYDATLAQTAAGTPSSLFRSDRAYNFLDWSSRCDDASCKPKTVTLACTDAGATGPDERAGCEECVNDRGYWLNPKQPKTSNGATAGVFHGKWLNFYPPKFLVTRLALKTVLLEASTDAMRIAVYSNKDGDGAQIDEPLHPPCPNSGSPDKKNVGNAVTRLNYAGTDNPIAELVTNIGQNLSQESRWPDIFGDGSSSAINSSGTGQKQLSKDPGAYCTQCQRHFVLLFSDGRGDEGNPGCVDVLNNTTGLSGADGIADPPCAAINKCSSEGLGQEKDGDAWVRDTNALGRAKVTGDSVRATPANTCPRDYADDIARFLYNTDMHVNGNPIDGEADGARQFAFTYTVGVGSDSHNKQAILREMSKAGGGLFVSGTNYVAMVNALRTAFEDINRRATSFSSASVSPVQTQASTNAYVPRFRPDVLPNWKGFLFSWGVFNEFVEDRNLNPGTGANEDDDKSDVWLVQKVEGRDVVKSDIIGEDNDGNFIFRFGGTGAPTPYWEAGEKLISTASTARKIWTAVDTNNDGKWEQIEFLPGGSELTAIKPYLNLDGTNFCANLAGRLGLTLTLDECAQRVVQFVRGVDVLDFDGDGDRTEDRPWKLGDIFHSSPMLVGPPADRFVCDLGLASSCVPTLYSQQLNVTATQLATYTAADGKTIDAYQRFQDEKKKRDRVLLVGANDGMLHAFHAGDQIVPEPLPTAQNPLPDKHTRGTGEELWAFIPPDLLPKLYLLLNDQAEHQYFVDGDVMVRDVWKDLDGDGIKQENEYRTVAVVAERRGGNHYMALDITDFGSDGAPTPKFLWSFPEPCSPEATEVGETFMTISPKPPPIGPVLLEKSSGKTYSRYNVDTEERWVVFLQGGYDVNYARGQGVYMLDVYEGKILWKRYFDPTSAPHLTHPFAAPIAAADYGDGVNEAPKPDGFFDIAFAADVGGQIHTLRMHPPGKLDSVTGRVTNWAMARGFEAGLTGEAKPDLTKRNPFFFVPSLAVQLETGALRALIGTGDRYNIRDPKAGICQVDNPLACGRYGCEVQNTLTVEYNGKRTTSTINYKSKQLQSFTRSVNTSLNTAACSYASVSQVDKLLSCPGITAPGTIKDRSMLCSGVAPYLCAPPTTTHNYTEFDDPGFTTTGQSKSRYYGLWIYGGKAARSFDPSVPASVTAFDNNRLRDGNLKAIPLSSTNPADFAATTSDGWYLDYAGYPERTASGSGVVASCTLWNTLEATATTTTCSSAGNNKARLYQANFVTGAPDCAAGFNATRSIESDAIATPPEPSVVVEISKNGEISIPVQSTPVGASQVNRTAVGLSRDNLQLIYSLDVPPELHECRHVDASKCE